MKIREKATGQIYYVEKSPVTQILLNAGLAEIVPDAPAPKLQIEWSAGVDVYTRQPYIQARSGAESFRYLGKDAHKKLYRGQACPPNIADDFKMLRDTPVKDRN